MARRADSSVEGNVQVTELGKVAASPRRLEGGDQLPQLTQLLFVGILGGEPPGKLFKRDPDLAGLSFVLLGDPCDEISATGNVCQQALVGKALYRITHWGLADRQKAGDLGFDDSLTGFKLAADDRLSDDGVDAIGQKRAVKERLIPVECRPENVIAILFGAHCPGSLPRP